MSNLTCIALPLSPPHSTTFTTWTPPPPPVKANSQHPPVKMRRGEGWCVGRASVLVGALLLLVLLLSPHHTQAGPVTKRVSTVCVCVWNGLAAVHAYLTRILSGANENAVLYY